MSAPSGKLEQKGQQQPLQPEDKMTEEDKVLVETLAMLVQRLKEEDESLHRSALEALRTQIRDSTSTMTSIPKALKFLRPHYSTLVEIHLQWTVGPNKKFLADILSVLSMAMGKEADAHQVLKYCLEGQGEPVASWGHEYVRHLAMETVGEKVELSASGQSTEHLYPLAKELCIFFLEHNAEPDACDLLFELEKLDTLVDMIDGQDHQRICLYLQSCVPFEAVVDDQIVLNVVHKIYRKTGDFPQAMAVALQINDLDMIKDDYNSCIDPLVKRQLAFMLARQRICIEEETDTDLVNIMSNTCLTDRFLELGKELEIIEPKVPEDVYKSHLLESSVKFTVPSAKQNLAASIVNAFVNTGFCSDKLLTSEEVLADDTKSWTHKNKEGCALLTTIASIGLINLWNPDSGLAQLDRYLYSDSACVKAGAILGIGLVHAGTKNEADPAWALLREHLEDIDVTVRCCAIMGLALAYAASARQDIAETLLPLVSDDEPMVGAMAALALGHLFVGTCNGDVASAILQTLMERDAAQLDKPFTRFFSLALGLLFMAKQEGEADAVLETLKAIEHPIANDTAVLVTVCAYAGTGNVLKVQEFLKICSTSGSESSPVSTDGSSASPDEQPSSSSSSAACYAVIGIGMLSMAEDIGREMSLRTFNHLMHFGDANIRKAVPLAIGLLYASNPVINVMDILSKYSHDTDKAVAVNAIMAMGLVAAGSNNAKMAQMLRQLSAYYQKDPDCLFTVRLAQGLVHMGKGTMTVNPIHSHRNLIAPASLAGLLSLIMAFTDAQSLIMEKSTYLLYFLASSMYPRFLITVDEDLKSVPLLVRVGQAVEVVAQAGKPKTITGFQTHTTPVLIAAQERAELATEEYIPLTPILEGFVIVKKNPNWVDESADLAKRKK